ncbi:MAG: helix-turn-helix domain-containing protein [Clostridia bacterium]|nr:helix-turn-helix domain-containing protein [Clostridia bacterium]
MEMAEIVMNPVRQRIFQYLLVHETGTIKDLRKALPDVPSASLYRHMKILTDSALLAVVGENRIRGTVESVYQLNKRALELEDADGSTVQMSLLSLCASFAKYFSSGHANPRKDMLLLSACTLTLTDEEFSRFLAEINQLAVKYMNAEVSEGSKTRQITLISAPADGQVV